MRVQDLIAQLEKLPPDAQVVLSDHTESFRFGLIRPLRPEEVASLPLGRACVEDGSWLCAWDERPDDAEGPHVGVLLGPR